MRKPDVDLGALRALVARVYGRRAVEITRTSSGTTTQIYRLQTQEAVHFLRVAEDQSDRYGVEVLVHERLLALGVRVPGIVYYEPFDPALDRSILITTEIPGQPISEFRGAGGPQATLRAAGRDLALINSIPVNGFGFVERSGPFPTGLSAGFLDAPAFIDHDLETDLSALRSEIPQAVLDEVTSAVQSWRGRMFGQPGRLAHGDFDGTHIYVDGAGYSGIIDFGEIRGADPLYDLGHFAVLAGESLRDDALQPLLAGYSESSPLTSEDLCRMWLWAALIGVRFLARTRGRSPAALRELIAARIAQALREQAH